MALCSHHQEPISGACARCGDHLCLVCTMRGKRTICYPCLVRREEERKVAANSGCAPRLFLLSFAIPAAASSATAAYLGRVGALGFEAGLVGATLGGLLGLVPGAVLGLLILSLISRVGRRSNRSPSGGRRHP